MADHSGFACSGSSLPACQSRNRWSSGVYASRISRCTADVVVAAISSPNGGTLAIKRLQDHRPHPRREPDHRLVVRYRAVPCDIRQGLRVGDRPALEEEITSLLLGENRWTVVPVVSGSIAMKTSAMITSRIRDLRELASPTVPSFGTDVKS